MRTSKYTYKYISALFFILALLVATTSVVFENTKAKAEIEREEHAEDEYEDQEHEEEDEYEDHPQATPTPEPTATITPEPTKSVTYQKNATEATKTETKPVQQIIIRKIQVKEIDKGYDIDIDKDGLVDKIDPDPKTSQVLFYTDSDGDFVPDFYDKYIGLDDFKIDGNEDKNANGIIDAYEPN